ncbi:glucose-1-phosphate adenylyltransferase [Niveibacterium sp. SC-1]|uniref:glucose-1-phosphate adenylyltransferase n=1 Tax=Niveibacterium sp. SC-1 TaxID=3135646 RepID=UPI00311E3E3A
MITRRRVLAFVMAGGEGTRLSPLTQDRSKPSVPFDGKHRIVDFVLSNLVNSHIYSIYLLVQYKSQSLIEHVRATWTLTPFIPEHFVTVVPPQMHKGPEWFQGTADAVWQNLHLIEVHRPDIIAVFGADHVYRMDVRQMVQFHCEKDADVTVATLPVPLAQCKSFGIVRTDADARVTGFEEKPEETAPMPGSQTHALASMGNYLFKPERLVAALRDAHNEQGTDFGRDVLPRLLDDRRIYAYDFASNVVPGVQPYEEKGYWRDVGTIEAYFDAHFDTLGTEPRFRMSNAAWPIFGRPEHAGSAQIERGAITRSTLGAGCVINGARLMRTVLRREVVIEEDAELDTCIVMDRSHVGPGARIRRAIIDAENIIPPGMRIGYDLAADRERFHVSESGIVVVGRGQLRGA